MVNDERPRPRPRGLKAIRAAGSRTALDVLRAWLGRGRDPEADLVDLAAGRTLVVSAFLREERWRQGVLTLDLSGEQYPITWQPWPRGPRRLVPLPAVIAVRPLAPEDGTWGPGADFDLLVVETDQLRQRFAVPMTDVPLLRAAFERAVPRSPGA